MEAKVSFLRNFGLQPQKKLKSNSKKVSGKTILFNCNGCEASFQSKIDLKQHLNLIHLKKSRTLKNSNVNADNIILYKRHIVKVKAAKSRKVFSIYFHLQKDERTYLWQLCAAMMSWVDCLLRDSGLFILFAESQIILKISVFTILLTFI